MTSNDIETPPPVDESHDAVVLSEEIAGPSLSERSVAISKTREPEDEGVANVSEQTCQQHSE